MGPRPTKIMAAAFVIAVILSAAFLAFIIYDTPIGPKTTQKYEIRHESAPCPEEDTMHYLTEEGVLIVYAP